MLSFYAKFGTALSKFTLFIQKINYKYLYPSKLNRCCTNMIEHLIAGKGAYQKKSAKIVNLNKPIGLIAGHTGIRMNKENGALPPTTVNDNHSYKDADKVAAMSAVKTTIAVGAEVRDKQLRARIKLLGNILGKVIKSQVGKTAYDAVEKLRTGYLQLQQEENPTLQSELTAFIESQSAKELAPIIRAFNLYFSLVNLAEEEHQYHERQSQLKSDGPFWTGAVLNVNGP